ncbi:unnamed protein product [Dracunculus medinensis]|uniref:Uncharacterized protein n=1 Tax=Dracunculus medinensis TaxID=318479 RepID=A0A0N4URI8_DRAME|nr:unnamed protein product [Dracunculus medinensis]
MNRDRRIVCHGDTEKSRVLSAYMVGSSCGTSWTVYPPLSASGHPVNRLAFFWSEFYFVIFMVTIKNLNMATIKMHRAISISLEHLSLFLWTIESMFDFQSCGLELLESFFHGFNFNFMVKYVSSSVGWFHRFACSFLLIILLIFPSLVLLILMVPSVALLNELLYNRSLPTFIHQYFDENLLCPTRFF